MPLNESIVIMQADQLYNLKQKANQSAKSVMPLLTEMPPGYDLCILGLETDSFSFEELRPTSFFVIMGEFSTVSVDLAMNCSP